MSKSIPTTAALLAGTILAGGAYAASPSSSSGAQLSQAECQSVWNQANPSNASTINMSQAQPYVSDFKGVDTDNDGTISLDEFNKGCNAGLVKSSSASGSSSGSSGSTNSPSGKY